MNKKAQQGNTADRYAPADFSLHLPPVILNSTDRQILRISSEIVVKAHFDLTLSAKSKICQDIDLSLTIKRWLY